VLREAFERDGIVRVAGAIAEADVRAMRDCARAGIASLEVVEIAGALRPQRGTELAMWAIGREPAFAPLPAALARAVDGVFGPGVWAQVDGELGGLAMPNLPAPGAVWTACGVAWHVDEPTPVPAAVGRVLIAYALLDVVEPGGGATVVFAGSQRRLAAIADRLGATIDHGAARGALASDEPWFAAQIEQDSARHPSLVELTGEAGDIILLDPRCLHTISANVSTRPRLIMRLTCVRSC
jgi:hypothetical protein